MAERNAWFTHPATHNQVRIDLPLLATFWLSASWQMVIQLLRGSDGCFVGPASQALSLPWFESHRRYRRCCGLAGFREQ